MADTFKSIPIKITTGSQEHAEIKSCAEAEPYALRVIGDSMEPEFLEGHILIIDPAMPPQHAAAGSALVQRPAQAVPRRRVVVMDAEALRLSPRVARPEPSSPAIMARPSVAIPLPALRR